MKQYPIAPESFNDDDWYIFNTETNELVATYGSHYRFASEIDVAPDHKAMRGLSAKWVGLWKAAGESK